MSEIALEFGRLALAFFTMHGKVPATNLDAYEATPAEPSAPDLQFHFEDPAVGQYLTYPEA